MDLEGFGLGSDNVGPILRPPQPPESTAWFLATAPSSESQKRIRSPTFASYRLIQLCVGWEAVCLTSLIGWVGTWDTGPPSLPWALPNSPEIHPFLVGTPARVSKDWQFNPGV